MSTTHPLRLGCCTQGIDSQGRGGATWERLISSKCLLLLLNVHDKPAPRYSIITLTDRLTSREAKIHKNQSYAKQGKRFVRKTKPPAVTASPTHPIATHHFPRRKRNPPPSQPPVQLGDLQHVLDAKERRHILYPIHQRQDIDVVPRLPPRAAPARRRTGPRASPAAAAAAAAALTS